MLRPKNVILSLDIDQSCVANLQWGLRCSISKSLQLLKTYVPFTREVTLCMYISWEVKVNFRSLGATCTHLMICIFLFQHSSTWILFIAYYVILNIKIQMYDSHISQWLMNSTISLFDWWTDHTSLCIHRSTSVHVLLTNCKNLWQWQCLIFRETFWCVWYTEFAGSAFWCESFFVTRTARFVYPPWK